MTRIEEAKKLKAKGWKQADIAKKLGVHHVTVWKWLNPDAKCLKGPKKDVNRKCSNCQVSGHYARTCKRDKTDKTIADAVERKNYGVTNDKKEPESNGYSKSISYLKYRVSILGHQLNAINLVIAELEAAKS